MFSPESSLNSAPSGSLRSTRRRPRNDSDGSTRQAPLRKRSKLAEDHGAVQKHSKINGNSTFELNGHATASHTLDIPLREKRVTSGSKRVSKDDGTITLANTANYTIKKLPSLPEHLRHNPDASYRGFALHTSPYALALTHTHAYIWDYTSHSTSSSRALPLDFNLGKSDPLPIGALIRSGPSSELGVVVVCAKSGKITFWDNVDSAESLSIFQQRRPGVEGSIGGLLSGEHVLDIADAGVAGFVLTLSTGRLTQLTVRDAQGRPAVRTHFVRINGQGGGLLSGLKNVFATGSSWRKEVAAVKTQKSISKGQSQVITVTRSGLFQVWELGWEGQHTFIGQLDTYTALLGMFQETLAPEMRGNLEINVLDFAIIERPSSDLDVVRFGHDHTRTNAPLFISVLAVVGMIGPSGRSYALAELDLSEPDAPLRTCYELKTYSESFSNERPVATLLRPSPKIAFVVFKRAIAMVSTVKHEAGPEDQLGGSHEETPRYQDVLHLPKDSRVRFVGTALEEYSHKEEESRCLLFTSGSGVLRITGTDSDQSLSAQVRSTSAKSKLEQTVFYGAKSIFDFAPRNDLLFPVEQVEEAALQISHEIVASSSAFLSKDTSKMQRHLRSRADYLSILAAQLKRNYPPLSRTVKWTLMHNAEKVAAALAMWDCYEARCQDPPEDHREPLLHEAILGLHGRYKSEIDPSIGETDENRQWFIKDVGKIEKLLPWIMEALRRIYTKKGADAAKIANLISEGDDLVISALSKAFRFREDNVTEYGLEDEDMKDAILQTGYAELPSPWTSTYNLMNSLRELTNTAASAAFAGYEDANPSDVTKQVLMKLAVENPQLVLINCQVWVERYRWCLEQNDPKIIATGEQLKESFETEVRPHQLRQLAPLGQVDEGMRLAEQFHDLATLVALAGDEAEFLENSYLDAVEEGVETYRAGAESKFEDLKAKIRRYFQKYKQEWADEWYHYHIRTDRSSVLFANQYAPQLFTQYLQAEPSRARLAWINEVVNEKDYLSATSNLVKASSQEGNIWSRKVESSLAKLSLIASKTQTGDVDQERIDELEKHAEWSLQIVRVQERLYDFLREDVMTVMARETIVDACLEKFGSDFVDKRPALRSLLKQGLELVLQHRSLEPDLLIDVLTLMNDDRQDPEQLVSKNQSNLALEVLDAGWKEVDPIARDSLYRLIWKRCYLRDDWAAINATANKSDADVSAELEQTSLYWTLKDNAQRTEKWEAPSNIKPVSPSKALHAHTDPSQLRSRFPNEDLRTPIIRDNIADDKVISNLIDKHRLDHWYEATRELVLRNLEEEEEAERREEERMTRDARGLMDRLASVEPDVEEDDDDDDRDGSGGSGGFEGDDERGLGGDGDEMDMD